MRLSQYVLSRWLLWPMTVLWFLSVSHFILCLKSFVLSVISNLISLSWGYFNLFNYSHSMFINLNRSFQLHSFSLLQTGYHIYLCRADFSMSGLEYTCYNLPSPCAWVHTVLRTVWCWSGCCQIWLKQEWLPSCTWPKKKNPYVTEDIDIYVSSCMAISNMLFAGSTLWLRWAAISHSSLCSIPIRVLFISLVNKCPVKSMNKWKSYSRHELTTSAHTFVVLLSLTMIEFVIFWI